MATGTIQRPSGFMRAINHTVTASGSVSGGGFKDIVTDITPQNSSSFLVVRYAGNPSFILSNQWVPSGSTTFSITMGNTSSSSKSFSDNVYLTEIYTV